MSINLNDHGYNDVPASNPGEFTPLPAGGYICRIINAEITNSKAGNLMLVLFVDIADGDFQGYFKAATDNARKFNPDKKWDNSGIYRQLLFDKTGRVASFFKGLITCIERSNDNLKINISNFEPTNLRGLLCGFIFAAEEYQRRDGSIAEAIHIKFPKSTTDINNGNFKVPAVKRLDKPADAAQDINQGDIFNSGEPIDQNDIPF